MCIRDRWPLQHFDILPFRRQPAAFAAAIVRRIFGNEKIELFEMCIRDRVRPLPVIGHQHQSGGVDIQSTCGVQLMRDRDKMCIRDSCYTLVDPRIDFEGR